LQAKEADNYRDAEPGKILHEMRYGELAHFKLVPHTPYYGTADATPLYLIALHAAWRALGDRALLEQHLETADGCLSWIDAPGGVSAPSRARRDFLARRTAASINFRVLSQLIKA